MGSEINIDDGEELRQWAVDKSDEELESIISYQAGDSTLRVIAYRERLLRQKDTDTKAVERCNTVLAFKVAGHWG